MLKTATFYKPL